jgi:hypothetical protein
MRKSPSDDKVIEEIMEIINKVNRMLSTEGLEKHAYHAIWKWVQEQKGV